MTLGFNMAGTEERFEHWLNQAFSFAKSGYIYLEIGVAHCRTFFAVARYLNEHRFDWAAVGSDVIDGPYFNAHTFLAESPFPSIVSNDPRQCLTTQAISKALLVALGPLALPNHYLPIVRFCLIDGCHGKASVMQDFKSIENLIPPGGIVAFHDACLEDQGNGIGVREALHELQLIPSLGDPNRDGWKFLEEVHGDKSTGDPARDGNGFVFIQKL